MHARDVKCVLSRAGCGRTGLETSWNVHKTTFLGR